MTNRFKNATVTALVFGALSAVPFGASAMIVDQNAKFMIKDEKHIQHNIRHNWGFENVKKSSSELASRVVLGKVTKESR